MGGRISGKQIDWNSELIEDFKESLYVEGTIVQDIGTKIYNKVYEKINKANESADKEWITKLTMLYMDNFIDKLVDEIVDGYNK